MIFRLPKTRYDTSLNLPTVGSSPVAETITVDRVATVASCHWAYQNTLLQNRPLFQAICPGSLWARDNRWFLSRVQRLAGPTGGQGPFIPVGGSNRDKRPAQPFVPVGSTNRDKKPLFCLGWCLQPGQKTSVPLLAQLAVGPGTKATYCPGPKGYRDKWPGTKTCFVVVTNSNP